MDWKIVSQENGLSESFIDEFQDKINWTYLCEHAMLSESFIQKYKNQVDWAKISNHQKLSLSFIRFHKSYVDPSHLLLNEHMTEEILEHFADQWSMFDWRYISSTFPLSESFIEAFHDKVDWTMIPSFPNSISLAFVKKHVLYFSYEGLQKNPYLDFQTTKEEWNQWVDETPIKQLNTTVRNWHILQKNNYFYVKDIKKLTKKEFLSFRNSNERCFRSLQETLDQFDIQLQDE